MSHLFSLASSNRIVKTEGDEGQLTYYGCVDSDGESMIPGEFSQEDLGLVNFEDDDKAGCVQADSESFTPPVKDPFGDLGDNVDTEWCYCAEDTCNVDVW